jgi:hypothetical protein
VGGFLKSNMIKDIRKFSQSGFAQFYFAGRFSQVETTI